MCESKGLTKPEGKVKAKVWRRLRRQPTLLVASTELIPISHAGDGRKLRAHICCSATSPRGWWLDGEHCGAHML